MLDKDPNYRIPRRFEDNLGFDIAFLTDFEPEVAPDEAIPSTTENYVAVMELGNMFGVSSIRKAITGEL